MARNKDRQPFDTQDGPRVDHGSGEQLFAEEPDDASVAKAGKPAATSTVAPLADRETTVAMFTRNKGPLGKAFAACEALETAGREVKRTHQVWNDKYASWLKKPRG